MTQIYPQIKLLTYQEARESGLKVKALVFSHRDNNYHLVGGTGDTIYIFTESVCLYILTINKRLGYIGINAYMTPEPDPINSFFMQNTREIIDYLGKNWEGMKPETIVKRLIECLY